MSLQHILVVIKVLPAVCVIPGLFIHIVISVGSFKNMGYKRDLRASGMVTCTIHFFSSAQKMATEEDTWILLESKAIATEG